VSAWASYWGCSARGPDCPLARAPAGRSNRRRLPPAAIGVACCLSLPSSCRRPIPAPPAPQSSTAHGNNTVVDKTLQVPILAHASCATSLKSPGVQTCGRACAQQPLRPGADRRSQGAASRHPPSSWRPINPRHMRDSPHAPCPAAPTGPGKRPAAPGYARTWAPQPTWRRPMAWGGLPPRQMGHRQGGGGGGGRLSMAAVAATAAVSGRDGAVACVAREPRPPFRVCTPAAPLTTKTRSRLCRRSRGSCLKFTRMFRM
jgi:hypothetical protein